jgi:N-acetylglucosamine-1-phosphodiester alpha-N-acetylglucosaminidase
MDTPRKHNDEFVDLVSGVIWLVRNGEPYVAQSSNVEDMSVQESGHEFITLRASRVGLGHDAYGKLMIVQFDGDGNHHKGPNLYELAEMMIELGAINAINLDGGGSTTVIQDDVLANTISDGCGTEPMFRCARKVTTVTCIHDLWEDTQPTTVPTVTPSTTVEANCTREYESVR